MAPAGAALPRRSRAVDVETGLAGSRFTVQTPDGDIAVSAPLRGQFNVYNVLRAFTAARALGVPAETAGRANRDRRTSAGPVRDGGRRPTGRRPGRLCAHAGLARERPAGGEGPGEQRRRVTQTSRARRVGLRRGPGSRQAPADGEIATRLADWVIVTSAAGFSANCPKWGHDGGLRVFLRADGDAELFCGNCHGGDELTEAVRLSACHLRLSAAARLGTAAAPAASSTCARRWRPRPRPSRTVPPFAIDATVTLLVGRPGESKTWLGLVACAAVDGEFDTEPLSYASGRALYLDAENGQRKMGRRFTTLGPDPDPDRGPAVTAAGHRGGSGACRERRCQPADRCAPTATSSTTTFDRSGDTFRWARSPERAFAHTEDSS
jgi:hypothetical protein